MSHPLLLTLAALLPLSANALWCPPKSVPTAYINPGTSANLRGPIHPIALANLSCVVNKLKEGGYPVRTLWGYGCRPLRTSNHPRGLAVDVNQSVRNVTTPRMPANATAIANSCNVTHGAVWKNPDGGHFEMRSLSRRQQRRR